MIPKNDFRRNRLRTGDALEARGWSRRQVLHGLAASGLLGVIRWPAVALASGKRPSSSPFEPDRRKTLAVATERVLPGAIEAGVPEYLDYWMVRHPFDRYIQKLFKMAAVHL